MKRALARPTRATVAVHLRHLGAADRELVRLGRLLRRITEDAGARLVVNRRADVALAIGADGVHLPERGITPDEARQVHPGLVGVSRHDLPGLLAAEGADYAFLSPVHTTPGKGRPLGARGFDEIARRSPVPVIALGGMTASRVRELRHASGVAVIRAVLHSPDPARAMQALDAALAESG